MSLSAKEVGRISKVLDWIENGVPSILPNGQFVRDDAGNVVRSPASPEIVEEGRMWAERMKAEKASPRPGGNDTAEDEDDDD